MVPSREECLHLLKKCNVPGNIIDHSRKVYEVAVCLCRLLNRQGEKMDEGRIAAASWLHDIAKMDGLQNGENHSLAGARLLAGMGYFEVAEIVRQHVVLDAEAREGPIGEAAVVHYADKRVKHDVIVSLRERFEDLKERYGKTPEAVAWITNLEDQTLALERRIFEGLPVSPEVLKSRAEEGNCL